MVARAGANWGWKAAGAFALLIAGSLVRAQETPAQPDPPPNQPLSADAPANDAELSGRVERLEQQSQQLLQQLQAIKLAPVPGAVVDPAASGPQAPNVAPTSQAASGSGGTKDTGAAASKPADDWYRIGTLMDVTAKFNQYGYLWLTTPKGDFTMHPGAWFQLDNVFWTQSAALRIPPDGRPGPAQGVASGVALGGNR